MDKKDEIIKLQLDLIECLTESNLSHMASDLWGPGSAPRPCRRCDSRGGLDWQWCFPSGDLPTLTSSPVPTQKTTPSLNTI